ncbi:MAG: alpha/beta fold hydrolase [Candidatus Binatia bacterium]
MLPLIGPLALAASLLACSCASNREARVPHAPPGVAATSSVSAEPTVAATTASFSETAIARRTGHATAKDGTRLYFEACGAGPAMVFVHGLGGNHAVWFQQVAHFAAHHTVVTVSQRGFAPSGGEGARYQVETLVDDLETVMDAAGVAKAVVIGQSMGGWTALGLALQSPGRVTALVLADTLGGISDDEIAVHLRAMTEQASRLRAAPPPLGVHPALSAEFSRQHPDLGYLYQTLTTFGAPPADVIARQLADARVSPDRLRNLTTPTMFVVGADDRIFPPAIVKKAAAHVPGAQVTVIEGTGHSPYFESPKAWNFEVGRFLEGI